MRATSPSEGEDEVEDAKRSGRKRAKRSGVQGRSPSSDEDSMEKPEKEDPKAEPPRAKRTEQEKRGGARGRTASDGDEVRISMRGKWCFVCRGEDETFACAGKRCKRSFHVECAGLKTAPTKGWLCESCQQAGGPGASQLDPRIKLVQQAHRALNQARRRFLSERRLLFEPLCGSIDWFNRIN